MNAPAPKQPESYPPLHPACIGPSVDELLIARNRIADEFSRLDAKLQELTSAQSMGLAIAAALAAEEIAKIGAQIKFVAEGLHRGIAERAKLEPLV